MSFIISTQIHDLLMKSGYNRVPWQISTPSSCINIFKGPGIIWEVLPAQIETPITDINKVISDFFSHLEATITSMQEFGMTPSAIIFHGTGTIPIPDSFKKFCRDRNINVFVFDPNMKDSGLSELPYQKLEDELPELKGIFTGMVVGNNTATIQI